MKKRLLIIDNNKNLLDVMSEVFNDEGFAVKTIIDGNVFSQAESFKPNLIIIDFVFNGGNGGEISKQLKMNSKLCNVPVLIMSAYSEEIDLPGNYSYDKFIAKPCELKELIDSVNALIYQSYTKSTLFQYRTVTPLLSSRINR